MTHDDTASTGLANLGDFSATRRMIPVAFLAIVYPIAMMRRGRAAAQTELPLGAEQPSLRLPLVPFGVFLAPAAAVMLVWGDRLLGRVFLAP